ncbi:hypothetical protein [Haloferax sp. YSSS75]|uniref:hypothetical protein n=1 Tax=Haloferax sp. YSSS75 TaxID=3388564 RepID=UPI00398D2C20
MTDADAGVAAPWTVELSARRYRHLDRVSKLLGVALVALGLEMGGNTLGGLSLGLLGAVVALTTVFVHKDQ